MTRVLRIVHTRSGRHFIVDGLQVFVERSPGQIGSDGLMLGPDGGVDPETLVKAAAYFTERYEEPCPGTPYVVDRDFVCVGPLNVVETQRFKDGRDVAAVRTALETHLDFFDRDTADGSITFGENWRGWRRLGYGFFRSLVGAIGAALVFGRIARRFAIDITHIAEKRRPDTTGLYDAHGEVNREVLAACMAAFRRSSLDGTISQDKALEIIRAKARTPGSISKRQFKSLFELCTRLNRHRKVITERQFEGLFDGSLLHLAGSIPDAGGRLRRFPRPASAPLFVRVAVLIMAVGFGWRLGNPLGIWSPLNGWLIVAASWLLYAALGSRSSVERSVVLIIGVLAAASVWSSLSWNDWLQVWPLILLTAAVAIGQQWRPVLQYAFYGRFPLLLALTIALLPIVGIFGTPLLFKSMFVLGWRGIVFVVLLTALAAEVAVASGRTIAQHAHIRFSIVPPWRGPADLLRRRGTALAAILALPVGVAVFWFTETSRPIAALAVVAGFLLSMGVKRAAEWLGHRLTSLRPSWRDAIALKLAGSDGYVDNGTVVPGHLANAGLFATTLVVYAIGYYVLKPNGLFEAPAIAFVLFMLIMLGWFLPAVSFFADKYRVSTVLSLAAIPYVLFFINDIDHYYFDAPAAQPQAVAQAPGGTPLTSDLRTAFEARMGRAVAQYPDGRPVIIAVAAGGGGGSAALWSVRVLAGLQQQFGARFTDSIEMVSAVSGGSIGTVHFMDAFDTAASDDVPITPTDARLEAATRGAGRSMLAAVAWGLAYPDFWRLFSVPHWNLYVDRGWALEEALDGRLNRRGVRLSQWRDGILSGHRPNVMFNATVSETGDRLVISPVRLGRVSESCRSGQVVDASCDDQIDAYTLSLNSDLRVAAAARLSATFPFVMPIPKPRLREGETPYHIADGGYYDNGGLLTLVEWSRKVLTFPAAAAARKMLIIDIRVPDPMPAAQERAGWLYTTVGPLLTILNARTTSQVSRNMLDVSLLSDSEERQGVDIELVTFPLKLTTSRAWHLPAAEQKAIDSYWKENEEVQSARKQVCGVLKGAGWTNADCG